MAIPDYETLMLPTLQIAADKNEHSFRETIDLLAQKFNLTEEERKELLPSGRMPILNNRVRLDTIVSQESWPLGKY